MFLLVVVLFFGISAAKTNCNANDHVIFSQIGHTFATAFRNFGGLRVNETTYVKAVMEMTGLTLSCAQCYGRAYICGYDNCSYRCMTDNRFCTWCLESNNCISDCNKCTKFGVYLFLHVSL